MALLPVSDHGIRCDFTPDVLFMVFGPVHQCPVALPHIVALLAQASTVHTSDSVHNVGFPARSWFRYTRSTKLALARFPFPEDFIV